MVSPYHWFDFPLLVQQGDTKGLRKGMLGVLTEINFLSSPFPSLPRLAQRCFPRQLSVKNRKLTTAVTRHWLATLLSTPNMTTFPTQAAEGSIGVASVSSLVPAVGMGAVMVELANWMTLFLTMTA